MESFLDFLNHVSWWGWILIVLVLVAIRDIFLQKKHSISHNFPMVGIYDICSKKSVQNSGNIW